MIGHGAQEVHESGLPANAPSLSCADCGFAISLSRGDEIPVCPECGGRRFHRASMFEQPTLAGIQLKSRVHEPAEWLEKAREMISRPGKYLAVFADGRRRVIQIDKGWSRIGRSPSADIRLDDPTVSRRHAVVVQTPEGELRVLDDRSLNGIEVNDEQVDWSPINDGDSIQVGRYTLHVIESAGDSTND